MQYILNKKMAILIIKDEEEAKIMLRIVADTGSDISYLRGAEAGIDVIELDIRFDDLSYDYRNDPDFSAFYSNLTKSKTLPTTSQVTPGQYLDVFEDAKAKGDEVLVITLSSGLSGTYSSAISAQEMCGYDKITVIDSKQGSISLKLMVEHANKLRNEGKSRADIEKVLLDIRDRVSLLVILDTLSYLKKGGRVPPAMAFLGEALSMKPILALNSEGKVEPIKKVRGFEAAKKALFAHFDTTGFDEHWPVYFGYTQNKERGESFMQDGKSKYNFKACSLHSVGGVIGTHSGPNAVAVGYVKK